MTAINIEPIIEKIRESLKSHHTETGYARYPGKGDNEYGIADALNIMFTIDGLPSRGEIDLLTGQLKEFQSPETGLFDEGTHHPCHCTAHCVAALELFSESPRYDITALDRYRSASSAAELLSSLEWATTNRSGHIGAGIFSALYLTKTMTPGWEDAFFDWLTENSDPETGISVKGAVSAGLIPMWNHMADWFHFLFCFHASRRAFPNAERLVDSCITMYDKKLMPESFGRGQRFLDVDWTFTLNRASVQSGYRLGESRERLEAFARGFTDYLRDSDLSEPQWRDMHLMFGAVCALSELQTALPGLLRSRRALRQVLDIRPFI